MDNSTKIQRYAHTEANKKRRAEKLEHKLSKRRHRRMAKLSPSERLELNKKLAAQLTTNSKKL